MTIALVAVSTASTGAGSPSITVTKPSGVVAGDVMLAAVSSGADVVVALLNGWREIDISPVEVDVTGGSGGTILVRLHVYIRVANGNEPASYTWELEGATVDNQAAAIVAYRDVDNTTPINVSAKAGSAAPNTAVPGFTTTVDNCMQVALYAHDLATTYTPPSGMTEQFDLSAGDHTISGSDVLLGTAGAEGAKTATPAAASTSGAFSVALQPAVAPTLVIGQPPGLPEDVAGGFSLG